MHAFSKKGLIGVARRASAAIILLSTVVSVAVPVVAAEPALKAITPQMDPSVEKKPMKPLHAGLQHTENLERRKPKALRANTDATGGELRGGAQQGGFAGRMRGGAQTANTDTLKSRLGNNALNAAATAGVGIIGVKFVLTLGKPPVINRVFPGTPAYSLGMQKNDTIVAVDGVPTYGLSKEEVYDLIIGSPGTKVNVSIMRSGDFRVYNCTRMDINDLTDPVVRRDYLMSM
jgi:hypothetical protein